tara:strand:- start:867 stop:1193 length:327 start_codon:yes stop_codon:yes gene_type:complete
MLYPSINASLMAFIGAATSGGVYKLASTTTLMPSWVEHSAMAALFGCLIFAVRVLWKRNRELAEEAREDRERFHKEIVREMQGQIDAASLSRDKLTAVLKELSDKVDV